MRQISLRIVKFKNNHTKCLKPVATVVCVLLLLSSYSFGFENLLHPRFFPPIIFSPGHELVAVDLDQTISGTLLPAIYFPFELLEIAPDTYEGKLYLKAMQAYKKEKYAESEQWLEQIKNESPNSREAVWALLLEAEIALVQQRYSESGVIYESILNNERLEGVQPYILYNLAWIAVHENNDTKAFRLLLETQRQSSLLNEEIQLLQGYLYLRQKRYLDADITLEKLLSNTERYYIPALFYSAEAKYFMGEFSEAQALYEKLSKLDSFKEVQETALYSIAYIQYRQRKYTEGAEGFKQFIDKFPFSPHYATARYHLALCYEKLGNYDKSTELMQGLQEPAIQEPSHYAVIRNMYQSHKYKEVSEQSNVFRRNFPKSKFMGPVLIYQANSLSAMGQHLFAKNIYRIIVTDYPNDPNINELRYKFALSLFKSRVYDKAIEQIDILTKAGAGNKALMLQGLIIKGESQYNLKKYNDAMTTYRAVLDLSPGDELKQNIYYGIGWCLFKTGDYAKAIDNYRQAIAVRGSNSITGESWFKIADCHVYLKEYPEAANIFDQIVNDYPLLASMAAFKKGKMFYRAKEFESARRAYQFFVEKYRTSDDGPEARYWIAWTYFRQELYAEAQMAFKNLEQQYPKTRFGEEAIIRQADCFYNLEEYAQAKSIYLNGLKSKFWAEDALYGLILTHLEMQEYTEAKTRFQEFAVKFPKSVLMEDVRSKIEAVK